jgi:hypothetical protein
MPLFAFYLDAVDQALSEKTQQTECDAILHVALLRYSQLQNPAERMRGQHFRSAGWADTAEIRTVRQGTADRVGDVRADES